jgi:hypothetical protein
MVVPSCKENPYKKAIVGDWKLVAYDYNSASSVFHNCGQTFSFRADDSLIVGLGVSLFKKRSHMLDNQTVYKIENDSLYIFGLSDSCWQKRKIKLITKDSLIFQNAANQYEKYVRIRYISKKKQFDKIILTTSGGWGSFPVMSVQLERNGNFYFIGEQNTERIGYFKAKVPSQLLDRLIRNLDNVDILKLEDGLPVLDSQCLSVVFMREDTIIKQVLWNHSCDPPEYQTTVFQLKYLYQQLNLDSISKSPIPLSKCRSFSFEKNRKHLALSSSLCFLLWPELIDYDLKKIETDGRFYQFIFKSKPSYAVDLGYNFVDRYLKMSDFRKDRIPLF